MQEKKIIVEHSTVNLAFQVEKLIHEGWKIDENHPFQSIGVHYECGLIKVDTSAKEELLEQLEVANDIAKDITAKVEVITNILENPKEPAIALIEEKKQEDSKVPVRQAGRPKSK